jgi:hypothetical protein
MADPEIALCNMLLLREFLKVTFINPKHCEPIKMATRAPIESSN